MSDDKKSRFDIPIDPDQFLQEFDEQTRKDAHHFLAHVLLPAINTALQGDLCRNGRPTLSISGMWMALLMVEALHRQTVKKHPRFSAEEQVRFIRAAKAFAEQTYAAFEQEVDDAEREKKEADPFGGIRFGIGHVGEA